MNRSTAAVARPLAPSRRRLGPDAIVGLACALALPLALLLA